MDASFKEKSAWLTFIAMTVMFGNYFGRALFFPSVVENQAGLLLSVLVIFVVIMIILHIGLAMGQKQEQEDERDHRVSGKAYRNAHIAIIATLVMSVGYLIFFDVGSLMDAVNMMVFAMVIGELTYLGSQLVYYRVGA